MNSMLTPTAASALIVVDELGAASLTDIARITRRSLSTVQRATHSLTKANVLKREWNRGPYTLAPGAPRSALREVAEWSLGPTKRKQLLEAIATTTRGQESGVPRTITNPRIRRAWPHALRRIVTTYHPQQVILFGSQSRGDADAQSDVDLLIVFDKPEDRRERQVAIRRLLADMPFAKDILVASPGDLSHPLPGTALADAVRDGVVVYQR